MKAVILAGGQGTRLTEESVFRPKPMIEIGGRPILWHIMKIYFAHGIRDFIICCGYKSVVIKEYFANYYLHNSDVTFDLAKNTMEVHHNTSDPWRVTLVDTGESTMTGGRLKRVGKFLKDEENFCFTYGDGVSDVDISKLIAFHQKHGKIATVTAVQPPGRFGSLDLKGDEVREFVEKPPGDSGYINGGFFVLKPKALEYIKDDASIWERAPMEGLARDGQMRAFVHKGFWQAMDTVRDKNLLEQLWQSEKPPWKAWT